MDLQLRAKQAFNAASLGLKYVFTDKPFYVSFDVTNYCNLRCQGCDYPVILQQGKLGKDAPAEEINARFENLYYAFGSMLIVLAGYEPTIRKDLSQIIRGASRYHLVGIVSNGTLITEKKAKDFWDSGLAFASVSMPSIDDSRYREIIGVGQYSLGHAKSALEVLASTAPRFHAVAITATIDNLSTPQELELLLEYAKNAGVAVSFQPYASSKLESADVSYVKEHDPRVITPNTLDTVWQGSLSSWIISKKKDYAIIGRNSALRNFDRYVREGFIEFKPRALKVYLHGSVSLFPEGETFTSLAHEPSVMRAEYERYVASLREKGPLKANNCYRCVNLTNSSSFVEMLSSLTIR